MALPLLALCERQAAVAADYRFDLDRPVQLVIPLNTTNATAFTVESDRTAAPAALTCCGRNAVVAPALTNRLSLGEAVGKSS